MSTTTATTPTTETIVARASRLILAATGEEYGDGDTVMDLGVGIVGGDPAAVWVTGNWNDRRRYDADAREWVTLDDMPTRLYDALERIGVDCWWYDQCDRCAECHRLVSTEVMFGTVPAIWADDAGHVCIECVAADVNAYAEEFINDSDKALPSQLDPGALAAAGWDESHDDYRSGWYGRADKPDAILAAILDESPEGTEVVFQITDSHMFETAFTVWTRTPETEED